MSERIGNQNVTHTLILPILFRRELCVTFNEELTCQYKHCNAQTPPLNVQYVELLCYKVCMFANMFTNLANMFVKFVNMFANLKSVRLDVCLTIFMFVSKTFVNNEFANTKRCSRTSRTHCSRTISVREPCLSQIGDVVRFPRVHSHHLDQFFVPFRSQRLC